MKRILLALVSIVVSGLLFLSSWQGYRYSRLSDDVADLEKQQKELLEANRDTIARIAYEQSPARVEEKAQKDLGLQAAGQSQVTRLIIGGAKTDAQPASGAGQ